MIDLNSKTAFSDRINHLVDDAILEEQRINDKPRNYLGGSLVGHVCDRNVQYQHLAVLGEVPGPTFSPRVMRIFDRGNIYEDVARQWLEAAGFAFSPNPPDISDFDGKFGGHVDGIITAYRDEKSMSVAPFLLPALWECKCLGSKGWKTLEKDGIKKYSPTYFSQVQIYMHYLQLKTCLFTAVNADTMDLLHLHVDYDGIEAAQLILKITRVFNATYLGELLPRVSADPAFYLCSYCPFRKPCWK